MSSRGTYGRRVGAGGYHGGLDGLRALAIIGVLLYHGGVAWSAGGFLGVEVFFVLSGFLITTLLLTEWRRAGRIELGAFWGRRARRLLPALFCLVVVVGAHQVVAGADAELTGLRNDGIATLFYFGNWHQIAAQSSYFAATGPTSPLQHTWSLAIEEQFYLFWPMVLLGILWLAARVVRRSRSERRALTTLLTVTLLGAIGSAVEAAVLYQGGSGIDRVYYGTDTRAVSLLTGASLAIALALLPATAIAGPSISAVRRRRLVAAMAAPALAAVLAMMALAVGTAAWLYPAGLVGLDLAVAVVIACVVLAPASAVARVFSFGPARALGLISYGVYLWHFPVFLWLDGDSTGLTGTRLLALRVTVTLLVSAASFFLIEQPVRRGRLPPWLVRSLAPVGLGGAMAALLFASAAASPSLALAPVPHASAVRFEGAAPACRVWLRDTHGYGLSPPPPAVAAVEQPQMEAQRRLTWNRSSRVTFHTCPPKRALLIGDSLAFSTGLAVQFGEQDYGVELANAAILGCAFTNQGQLLQITGIWGSQPAGCRTALGQWAAEARAFRAQTVVIELGYRDEFDWRWGGRLVHLGQPAFDAYVQQRIAHFVGVLRAGGRQVIFLSVPLTHPNDLPNGSPAPSGNRSRHQLINAIIRAVAARYPGRVQVVDLDRAISPGDRYTPRLGGHLCRFDGVHFTIYCGERLREPVLSAVAAAVRG